MGYSKDMELFGKMGMFIRRTQMEMGGHGMPGPGGLHPPCGGRPGRKPFTAGPENLPFRHEEGPAHGPQNLPFRHENSGEVRPHHLPYMQNGEEAPGPQGLPHGMRRPMLSREHLLVLIDEHPEGIRQKAISDRAGINQSSVSEVINKLESDGYIERTVDTDDKRATLLFLTEKGKARAAEVKDEREAMFRHAFAKLTEDEKQMLSDLLDKLLA